MKKLFCLFFISIFCLSCQKDTPVTITGFWKQISVYSRLNSGSFYWSDVSSAFPLTLELTEDGKYFFQYDVPAGHGLYQYNYSTKELHFEDSNGNVDIDTVSFLDGNYLVVDYSFNGVVEYRHKFMRN